MAITVLTIDELTAAALAKLRIVFPNRSTHPESLLGKLADAVAGLIWSIHSKVQQANWDATPQSKSTYEALAQWAFDYGLGDGTATGFGPLLATAAVGLTGTATGTPATVVWNGAGSAPTLVAPDGVTLFALTAAATIGGGGTIPVTLNATTAGTAGNLTAGGTVSFVSTIPGVSQSVTAITGPTTLGTDAENAADLLARLLSRLQDPPKGGTQHDWNVWAGGILATLLDVYGYAKRNGTGTVDEVVVYRGASGTARQVSAPDLATISDYVDTLRPVTTEGRRILTAYMPAANKLSLRTRIVAYTAGAFDWSSNTLALTVDTYTPNAGGAGIDTLKLSALAPADLKAAITAIGSGGTAPRIQIVSTGTSAPVIAEQITATAYVDGGGKTTLTLGTRPTAYVFPNAGDAVYSGGAAVIPIATAQLAYVDALGPSRQSGYADPDADWNDIVETEQLGRTALEAVDGDGSALAKNIVKVASVPQVTIAVGAGAAATTDFQTLDTFTNAPECAFVAHVAVTD